MLEKRFVRFEKDYPYRGKRTKGTVLEVKESDAQIAAWVAAGVVVVTDKDGKKIPEAKKQETKETK